MARFEIEMNGQRFEVEAPDQQSAIQALQNYGGQNAPVSPQAAPEQPVSPDIAGRLGQSAYSTLTGATQGATLGAYDELASLLGTPIKAAENLITGRDSINGMGDIGSFLGRSFDSALQGQRGIAQEAFDQAPVAFVAGDIAGSLGSGALLGGGVVSNVAKPTIAGLAARGATEGGLTGFGSGFNTSESDQLIDRLSSGLAGGVTGALLGGVTGGIVGGVGGRQQTANIPTSQALQDQAGGIYQGARAAGLSPGTYAQNVAGDLGLPSPTASPVYQALAAGSEDMIAPVRASEFEALANKLGSIAAKENVLLPNGDVNPTYTALSGPLKVLEAYKGRPVPIDQLLTIRTNIRDAAANPEAGVARIGMNMLDEFNDYAYRMYPQLEEADDLYWRGKTGELIDKLGELATSRSGQYSQSGIENGLRAEFRLLERQIIKGRVKGLPPELKEQISKVAQGDDLQNFARWVSKFGIQNPLTSLTGVGAGLASGSVLPALGIWGTAQGAGAVARALAFEKYNAASAIARAGGALPEWSGSPVAAALAGSSGGLSGQLYGD